MKIDDSTRFPYPVLSVITGDYSGVEFRLDVNIAEKPRSGKLEISFQDVITEPLIASLLESRKAALGLFVICLETYYNKLLELKSADKKVSFDPGVLKGTVILRPVIWALEELSNFRSNNLHTDFANVDWHMPKGSVLALGNELQFEAGQDKLAPLETIFTMARADDLKEGEFRVGLDSDKVTIYAASATFNRAHILRNNREGKAMLLNGLYLPVVMEVLQNIRDGGADFEGKRWFRIFKAKCQHLGIKPESEALFENAQKLLKHPFNRIDFGEEAA